MCSFEGRPLMFLKCGMLLKSVGDFKVHWSWVQSYEPPYSKCDPHSKNYEVILAFQSLGASQQSHQRTKGISCKFRLEYCFVREIQFQFSLFFCTKIRCTWIFSRAIRIIVRRMLKKNSFCGEKCHVITFRT